MHACLNGIARLLLLRNLLVHHGGERLHRLNARHCTRHGRSIDRRSVTRALPGTGQGAPMRSAAVYEIGRSSGAAVLLVHAPGVAVAS
jgi:hypothetical protein